MEIVCNLYKSKTGKWYGTHTFFPVISKFELPSDEEVVKECKKSYTHPEDYLIHVTDGHISKIILPEGAYFFSN